MVEIVEGWKDSRGGILWSMLMQYLSSKQTDPEVFTQGN